MDQESPRLAAAQREAAAEARRVLSDLDASSPEDMTTLHYVNGFESPSIVLHDLLDALEVANVDDDDLAASAAAAEGTTVARLNTALGRSAALRAIQASKCASERDAKGETTRGPV